jgi:hypothetical protein
LTDLATTIPQLPTTLTWRDTLKRWSLRWGLARNDSSVPAGLYRIGSPTSASPVLVTCNYRMTVDLVRGDLAGVDAWLLVLETYGVNVWCAAGKGTFSTDELVRRIYSVHLAEVVDHESIILPQLGAVGVAAQTVRELTGYRVIWGPVRSADLRDFLAAERHATPRMRAVTFTFAERMALAPVELLGAFRWIWAVLVLVVLAVLGASIGARAFVPQAALMALFPSLLVYVLGAVAGGVVVPAALPWLPFRAFSAKSAVAGALVAVAALALLPGMLGMLSPWMWAAVTLGVSAMASYVGVNFTGCTPYTSPSGVERELRRAIPLQATALALSLAFWTVAWATRIGG